MNKKTRNGLIGCVLAVVVLVCLCGGLLLCLGSGLIFSVAMQPYDVVVSVSSPAQVQSKDEIVIEVIIENPTSEPQVLDSIDIDLTYLEGFDVRSVSPPYRSMISLEPMFQQHSFGFDITIPAESELVIQFHGIALQPGDYSGQIDVCINSAGNCEGHILRTVVEE